MPSKNTESCGGTVSASKAIGQKKLVAGQEDLIFNILFNLKNSK